jgi:hypothetical protein
MAANLSDCDSLSESSGEIRIDLTSVTANTKPDRSGLKLRRPRRNAFLP